MPKRITFNYCGKLEDGSVFDDGTAEPHSIIEGRGQVMPLLEKALLKMEIGEERTVVIPAEQAYGTWDSHAVVTAPASSIPKADLLPEGEYIAWKNPVSSKPLPAKVISKDCGIVQLDLNHPLAGKNLEYWVKVTASEEKKPKSH